jgi:lambda repressor-like predicted transcriptional regulator
MPRNKNIPSAHAKVTAHKDQILAMRAAGKSWAAIAEELHLAYMTLRTYFETDYKPRTETIRQRIRERKDEVEKLRAEGLTWIAIANIMRVSVNSLRYAIDQTWADRANELKRAKRKARIEGYREQYKAGKFRMAVKTEDPREILGELPPQRDTRDLTARLMGDPLPGRSYLDRMRQQQQGAGNGAT